MNVVSAKEPVTGRIVTNETCLRGKSASFVRHLAIDISGTPLEGRFRVGQAFGVIPPGSDAAGKPHKVRLFSLACPAGGENRDGKIISTTIKRVIIEGGPAAAQDNQKLFLGVCSNYLCDLKLGDEIKVSGPTGKRLLLPGEIGEHDYLFVATGTGIAPFRGMILELLEGAAGPVSSQIHLLMGTPYTTDLLYDDLFTRLSRSHANFHYHSAISREIRPNGRSGLYVNDYLREHIDSFRPLLDSNRTIVYVCGLAGMQCGLFKVFAEHGLDQRYFETKEQLANIAPTDWELAALRRGVRMTDQCRVEVY
jgi:ferredoxin--NADP+ reductase